MNIFKRYMNQNKIKEQHHAGRNASGVSQSHIECYYCGGNCPNELEDSEFLCDGFAGDIDELYSQEINESK